MVRQTLWIWYMQCAPKVERKLSFPSFTFNHLIHLTGLDLLQLSTQAAVRVQARMVSRASTNTGSTKLASQALY